MPDEIENDLNALLGSTVPPSAGHADRLEVELFGDAPVGVQPRRGWIRFAAAAGVALLAAVGACSLPAEVPMEMGRQIEMDLPFDAKAPDKIQALAKELESSLPVEELDVMVEVQKEEFTDGRPAHAQMHATIRMWGTDLDPATIQDALTPFDGAEITVLEGVVQTTVGERFRHQAFKSALADKDVEAAKRAIVEELVAAGEVGKAKVRVEDDGDGHRRVEVRVEREEGDKELDVQFEPPTAPAEPGGTGG